MDRKLGTNVTRQRQARASTGFGASWRTRPGSRVLAANPTTTAAARSPNPGRNVATDGTPAPPISSAPTAIERGPELVEHVEQGAALLYYPHVLVRARRE
jgi:hypothetical protein